MSLTGVWGGDKIKNTQVKVERKAFHTGHLASSPRVPLVHATRSRLQATCYRLHATGYMLQATCYANSSVHKAMQ